MIKRIKEKVAQLGFFNRKVLIGGFVVMLLIALPVTLFLVNQIQDTRQRAASTGDQTNFSLEIVPSASVSTMVSPPQVLKGQPFSVKVKFDARAHRVLSFFTTISYDQTKFTLNSVSKTGTGFETVNYNTNIAPGQVRILAEADSNAPLNANGVLVATLNFTASSLSTGTGTVFFTDQTGVAGRAVGATSGSIVLTYDSQPGQYNVVSALPVATATLTPTAGVTATITLPPSITGGTGVPTVTTLSTPESPDVYNVVFNSAVNPANTTVNVIYRWGWTTAGTCASKTNIVNGPTGLTGNSVIQPNTTSVRTFPHGATVFWCASIYNPVTRATYYGNVLSFTTLGTPTVSRAPSTVTQVPNTATQAPGTTTVVTNPATATPVQTITLSATTARLDTSGLKLPGIGNNAQLGENRNPLTTKRTKAGRVYLYTAAGDDLVTSYPTNFTYSTQTGTYSGSTFLSGMAFNRPYIVKVSLPNTLQKTVGIVTPVAGQTTSLSLPVGVELVSGEIDSTINTNYVDLADYTKLLACFRNEASCTNPFKLIADLNDDGQIGPEDLNILIRTFANRPGD